jgi:TonB family protein
MPDTLQPMRSKTNYSINTFGAASMQMPANLNVALLTLLCVSASSAHAADRAPTEAELKRFVAAYRVGESSTYTMKLAVKASRNAPAEKQRFIQCMAEKTTPAMFEAVALDQARKQFPSAERLLEIITYLEGSAGKKILDQTMRTFTNALEKDEVALDIAPPDLAAFTRDELVELATFVQRPASKDFRQFVDSMKSDSTKAEVSPAVLRIRESCRTGESPILSTRSTESVPASVSLAEKDDPERMWATLEMYAKRQGSPGRVLKQVAPAYPSELARSAFGGTVRLRGRVTKTGDIESIEVIESSHPLFTEAAKAALGQWKFSPSMRDGLPVEFTIEIPFDFRPKCGLPTATTLRRPQRIHNLHPRRLHRRQKTADKAHEQGEDQRLHHDLRREHEAEREL